MGWLISEPRGSRSTRRLVGRHASNNVWRCCTTFTYWPRWGFADKDKDPNFIWRQYPFIKVSFISLKFESSVSIQGPSPNIVQHVQTSLECLLLSMLIVLISATKYAESGQLPSSLWFMDFHPSYQASLHVMRVVMYIGWITVQYSIHNTVQYNTVQYSTVQLSSSAPRYEGGYVYWMDTSMRPLDPYCHEPSWL